MADASDGLATDQLGFQTAGYFVEPPEVMARNLRVGVRLACAALVSFFGAFLFCFLYLREINSHSVWRPSHVKPPIGSGVAILACIVAAAALTGFGAYLLRRRGEGAWRIAAITAQLFMLAALAVQCVQWARLGFGPGSGAYASVFIGWTGFFVGVGILSALYWRQTTLAGSIRHREVPAEGPVVAVAGQPGGEAGFKARMGAEVSAFAFYMYFLACVEVVTFVLLYIVA